MSTHEETLFTSDTSSGRELAHDGSADYTPERIVSAEDDVPDEFTRTKINPIVGYLVSSARGAEMCGLPASADWEYLREGTRRIQSLMSESAARIAALESELAALKQTYRAECDRQDAQFAEIERLMTENAGLRDELDTMRRALDAILLMLPGNSAAWLVANRALAKEGTEEATDHTHIAALEAEVAKITKERDDFRDALRRMGCNA